MATLTATRAAATFPGPFAGTSGNLRVAYGSLTLAANPTAADVAQMVRLPAGAVVLGGWLMGADIDTGTEALDIDVGWPANGGSGTFDAADPDGFGNFGVLSGDVITELKPIAGIWNPLQGVLLTSGPVNFTRETIIQLLFNAAANAGGTGVLTLVVIYAVP